MKYITFCLWVVGTLILSGCIESGQGEKVGTVVKMAREGILCKTYEGQIIRGGLNAGTGASGAAFNFTVEDPILADKLVASMEAREEIRLKYRSEAATFCRSGTGDNHSVISFDKISDEVTTKPVIVREASVAVSDSRADTIEQLLKTQAALIEKLSQK